MLSSSVHIEEPETGQVIVNVRVKLPEYLRSKRVISTKTCIEYEQVVSDRSEATEDVGLRMQQEHEEPAVEKLAMVPEPDESEEVQEPSSTTFDEESVSEMGVQETLDSQEESHEEIVAKAPPSFVVPEQLVPASVEVEAEDEEPQRDSFVEEQPKAAPESPQRPFWASGSSRPDENTSASAPRKQPPAAAPGGRKRGGWSAQMSGGGERGSNIIPAFATASRGGGSTSSLGGGSGRGGGSPPSFSSPSRPNPPFAPNAMSNDNYRPKSNNTYGGRGGGGGGGGRFAPRTGANMENPNDGGRGKRGGFANFGGEGFGGSGRGSFGGGSGGRGGFIF